MTDTASRLALMIAVGIGLHNFAEGLAIGNSAATGELSLAVMLVVGFGLHNATEGFGIVAPRLLVSFPSGRAAGPAAIGLLCAWILCRWVFRSWATEVSVWAVSGAAIGLVGFSRLYLGVHFVTDVLAGWLLGAAWAGVVVLAGSLWSAVRRQR